MRGSETLPSWDLDAVFPGFDSDSYRGAKAGALNLAAEAQAYFESTASPGPDEDCRAWLSRAISLRAALGSRMETLSAYAYARFSTATGDPETVAELNAIEEIALPARKADVLFRNALAARRACVEALSATDPKFAPYRFHLAEELLIQSRQMSPELEDLAEDLCRCGSEAWSRLQEAVSSNASVLWNAETGERRTVVELRNLAYDPDRAVRQKAYELELSAWRGAEIPLAAALNGVKGTASILNSRRGWGDAIDKSLAQARISRKALDALISAMEGSLPMWRRYLKAKAKALGVGTLAFYDLFAPLGGVDAPLPTFSWDEAGSFIDEKFSSFDPAMGAFAARAFEGRWIDALPRAGKVGGAYCTDFPDSGVARVMCNYDGSFSSVTTVAHELGHAWHHECIKQRPYALTSYPMTLAETASIFAETIVSEAALAAAAPAERLFLLETHLQDGCQVIVDILSRYHFEKSVFEARKAGELSPAQFCAFMLDAQERTYGEGLDPDRRHPYMWAVKGHYYIPSLAFYNFPYAFGQLLGLGLYARYREEGPAFAITYRHLLEDSGSDSAMEVTRRAGFDIESEEFWQKGLGVFAAQAVEFESLVREHGAVKGL